MHSNNKHISSFTSSLGRRKHRLHKPHLPKTCTVLSLCILSHSDHYSESLKIFLMKCTTGKKFRYTYRTPYIWLKYFKLGVEGLWIIYFRSTTQLKQVMFLKATDCRSSSSYSGETHPKKPIECWKYRKLKMHLNNIKYQFYLKTNQEIKKCI